MHRQEYSHYSFLLLVVVVTFGTGVTSKKNPVSITYTCNGGAVDNITINNGNFSHVEVLTRTATYCQPSPTNKQTTLDCMKTFKDDTSADPKISVTTILYEEETHDTIVGGNNTKYYQLSCVEKASKKTAVMVPKMIRTTIPPKPEVLNADFMGIPSLKILQTSQPVYVGQEITLQMSVGSNHQLLPKICTAYRDDIDSNPYKFWENCGSIDEAITNVKSWTPHTQDDQGTMDIKMYAFRFIETDKLIIKCDTIVCPTKGDSACDMTCTPRRRRDADNHHRKTNATVSIALKVFDRPTQDNGSQIVSPVLYIYAIGFGMIYWITSKAF